MRHRLIVFLLCGMTGISAEGLAQQSLQPVQRVYPDSTLEEIQAAIDTGGTVYFDYLNKNGRDYGEYNQVASSTPDLPPTPQNPAKGFNIGKNGKDVHIIGVLTADGDRPKINGGTAVFRVGSFPGFGFNGQPVSFKIENLELSNPDMTAPTGLYSRIGVWVMGVLGAQSTIRNCKITIDGKASDPGYANNHSVAIWFNLPLNQPQPPASGARIDITNNTIAVSGAHEGIHVNSFWPETPGSTPPRAFLNNNIVRVSRLGGFANKMGTGGATLATAIVVNGNVSNSIVTNNVILGDGRSPNVTPKVESTGIALLQTATSDVLTSVTVVGNDLSRFRGDVQLRIAPVVTSATIARNWFGPAAAAGVVCDGRDNWLNMNRFFGDYPGWDSSGVGPGIIRFGDGAKDNWLTATWLNNHLDICGQVYGLAAGQNIIPGYEHCRTH